MRMRAIRGVHRRLRWREHQDAKVYASFVAAGAQQIIQKMLALRRTGRLKFHIRRAGPNGATGAARNALSALSFLNPNPVQTPSSSHANAETRRGLKSIA
jgi:hypothetical protein